MKILLGIIGLGIVVFAHELGHFIAAKLSGVTVEAFSVGMGPILLRKKIGETEWRLSLVPLGGYCAMKGEQNFQDAVDNNLNEIEAEADSFYGVHPLRRAAIAAAGPFANIIFAFLAYVVVNLIGYTTYTSPNKIILLSDFQQDAHSAAADAGLQTGDTILSIDGKKTPYFSDIYSAVSLKADETLDFEILRDGETLHFFVTPELDKSSGAGKIGVYSWLDANVSKVESGSAAESAGFRAGDKILQVDGANVRNTIELVYALEGKKSVEIKFLQDGAEKTTQISLENADDQLGLAFESIAVKSERLGFFGNFAKSAKETGDSLAMTCKSFVLLFKGIDLSQAVSGPIRITSMLGEVAKAGFSEGLREGIVLCAQFLALISVSLCVMNLLPIPILDGGLVLFAVVEAIRRRQIKPKLIVRFQTIGFSILLALFLFATFSDVKFLLKK